MTLFEFRRKKPSKPPPEPARYFEVWGEALSESRFFKKLALLLVLLNALTMAIFRRREARPPIVIRVSDTGAADVVTAGLGRVSRPEVLNFVRLFMKNAFESNGYTWRETLGEAFRMMTPQMKETSLKDWNLDGELKSAESEKWVAKVALSEVKVTTETSEFIMVSLKGWRKISSYIDSKLRRDTLFEGEMAIRKVPRSAEAPYGLLVESYHQAVFKDD